MVLPVTGCTIGIAKCSKSMLVVAVGRRLSGVKQFRSFLHFALVHFPQYVGGVGLNVVAWSVSIVASLYLGHVVVLV